MTDRLLRNGTTAEDELVRCCAQVLPKEETQKRLSQLVENPLDWETVLNRCWWHRIRPLAYRHLSSQREHAVPKRVLRELSEQVNELRARSARLYRVLRQVGDYFENAGVRAIAFKGPTLSEDAYGDLSLRECGDLDLLVNQSEFDQIAAALAAHGFQSYWERPEKNRQAFACEFERSDATLDVHWALSPGWLNYRVDFERMWADSIPLSSDAMMLRKFSPEDVLIVLCIHGTKHFWERLRWITDVAEFINREKVRDWDRLEALSIDSRCWRSVALGLWLAKHLLSASVPPKIMSRIDAMPGISRLGQQVKVWLGYAENSADMRTLRQRFLFRIGVCERRRDLVSQILHYLVARPASAG